MACFCVKFCLIFISLSKTKKTHFCTTSFSIRRATLLLLSYTPTILQQWHLASDNCNIPKPLVASLRQPQRGMMRTIQRRKQPLFVIHGCRCCLAKLAAVVLRRRRGCFLSIGAQIMTKRWSNNKNKHVTVLVQEGYSIDNDSYKVQSP